MNKQKQNNNNRKKKTEMTRFSSVPYALRIRSKTFIGVDIRWHNREIRHDVYFPRDRQNSISGL